MTEITTDELNDLLNAQLESMLKTYDTRAYNTFFLLKQTGIRAGEVNIKYWEYVNNNEFVLTPTKRNLPRIFNSSLFDKWRKAIITQNEIEFLNSYSNLMRLFQLHKQWSKIYVKDKEICMHLYRHNFARQLKKQGFSDEQIRVSMGEKRQTSADAYIYGKLYI